MELSKMYSPDIQGKGRPAFVKVEEFDPNVYLDAKHIVENQSDFDSNDIDKAQDTVALADFWN